jgi:hypothetical protein
MKLALEPYRDQAPSWPASGRHVMAQFDDASVVVYQAYKPAIGRFAAENGRFGGGFSFTRMTWIKPNFLWMMYRSGWGTKADQEVTLAVRLTRAGFESFLADAVPSSFVPALYATRGAWNEAVAASDVRLQWDPDHDPAGRPLERRAIQLGLRRGALERYATSALLGIEDVSAFVAEQRGRAPEELVVPRERVYPVPAALRARLGLDE